MSEVLMDTNVSRIKFNREVESLLNIQSALRKRGWIIESTIYPIVRVTFLATGVTPPVAAITVDVDFTNYNICAPSVRFLHPVQFTPLYIPALRKLQNGTTQNLMIQEHQKTKEPFLCLPGTYQYHIHPQHDGDLWDMHRYSGEGTLYFILEHIWQYCINSIRAYTIELKLDMPRVALRQEAVE